ncbi:MAG: hypothetical protein JHC93_05545 [Parachlamydiales bacterium]|nr:hypothetical protein [Parachlamydiales bacterium]
MIKKLLSYLLVLPILLLPLGCFADQVTVDLVEPTYSDGVFTTTQGGIIQAHKMRVQAMNITYTHIEEEGTQISTVQASDRLMVIYGKRQFVGKSMDYDFIKRKGIIYDGKVTVGSWFLGGDTIELKPDGSYRIHNGYITTSESSKSEWKIQSQEINIVNGDYVTAKKVQFKFMQTPFFWLPNYKSQLKSITDAPIETKFSVGGSPGTRAAFRYRVFDWKENKVFLRLDLLLKRGLGGGFETDYLSLDRTASLYTRNYVAHDNSIDDSKLRMRYRFHGLFEKAIPDHNVSIRATYDKLSDVNVATDYSNRSFDLPTARQTQLEIAEHTDDWQNDLAVRVRINNFQTINQELPRLESSNRPLSIGDELGVISENRISLSYLSYVFANDVFNAVDFHSSRLQTLNKLYRPINISALTLTPEGGFTAIYYGNTPNGSQVGQGFLFAGCTASTDLYNYYSNYKHIISPYGQYHVFSSNSTDFFDHYIFSVNDGFAHLNMMKMGINNALYQKDDETQEIREIASFDLFAYAFYHHPTFNHQIPKYYGNLNFYPSTQVALYVDSAWNREALTMDHINTGFGWTVTENFALSCDFLYRCSYDWRKSDHTNFVLDMIRPQSELLMSPLSDRRKTILSKFFYQFTPNWSLQWQSRYGFYREDAPNYFEYKVDLMTYLRSNWRIRVTYEHRIGSDNRFSVGVRLGGKDTGLNTRPPIW